MPVQIGPNYSVIMKHSLYFLFAFLLAAGVFTSGCSTPKKADSGAQAAAIDTDGDGLTDEEEKKLGTDPTKADTDGDALTDGDEVKKYKTNPLKRDSDGDELTDGEEVLSYNTNPLNPDTDGEGLTDGEEVKKYRTNPLNGDTDGDKLTDAEEVRKHKTDPLNPDTDGDGFEDGQEIEMGTNPLDPRDPAIITDLETITFGFDRSNLENDAVKALARNITKLQSNPKYTVQVNAYTDHIGGDQYNLRLSKRRANAVFEFYTKNGIDETRIQAQGLGKTPVPSCYQDDPDERGCRKDRRAESVPISPYKFKPVRKQL
jgi:outer membrane protein OmpA-like peptidoglycan-associated protein